ncbi:MAG TPA: NADH-quinone oxidoreductase subunit M, partial [bacterium]|nr:NADH-quinone oxidoreductase subunit M [bacterium]
MQSHLLSWIIFTPLIGAVLILFIPKSQTSSIKWVATFVTFLVGIFAFAALLQFNPSLQGFQMIEKAEWIPQFGVYY